MENLLFEFGQRAWKGEGNRARPGGGQTWGELKEGVKVHKSAANRVVT